MNMLNIIAAGNPFTLVLVCSLLIVALGTLVFFFSRYRRCPSDKILVIYGKTGGDGRSSKCIHGGAAFVWPIFQDFQYLDLTPIPIDIKLEGALSKQNIRVNTPSTFTVGVATEEGVMENAAERMLGLDLNQIRLLGQDIIFGQMRVVIATMDIESINADRDLLIEKITAGVEVELTKVGLRLINVNIQDITDESGYIAALGKEAAARAINEAKVSVAQQERDGEIGKNNAEREQRVQVADAQAIAVEGENLAKIKVAESDAARREREAEAERLAIAAEKVKTAQALEEAYASEQKAETARSLREKATQYANIVTQAIFIETALAQSLLYMDSKGSKRGNESIFLKRDFFGNDNPDFVRYLAHSEMPKDIFFSPDENTILINSSENPESILNRNLPVIYQIEQDSKKTFPISCRIFPTPYSDSILVQSNSTTLEIVSVETFSTGSKHQLQQELNVVNQNTVIKRLLLTQVEKYQ